MTSTSPVRAAVAPGSIRLDDPEPNDPLEADQEVRPAEYEVSER